jgi:hypothetical protein
LKTTTGSVATLIKAGATTASEIKEGRHQQVYTVQGTAKTVAAAMAKIHTINTVVKLQNNSSKLQ